MKNFSKNIIIWLIVWIFATSSTMYAATTQSWTLGALFEKMSSNYFLKWDSIKQNTVDSTEIEDNTLQWIDIKDETIESRDIKNGTILKEDIKTGVIPTKLSELENDITAEEVDPHAVKITWDQIKTGVLQMWNSSRYSDRRNNVIKFGGDDVKIWEYENNDKLTLKARLGVSIIWPLFVNGKYYTESTMSHADVQTGRYPSGNSRSQAERVAVDGGLWTRCSNLSNANVRALKLKKWARWRASSWYWGGQHYTSLYRLTWDIAREYYEKDWKIIKSVTFGNSNYTDGGYTYRSDLRDGCRGDTIPFSTFNIKVEYKDVTTLVNLR